MKETPEMKRIRTRIKEALEANGPYSHNIISLCLREATNKFGQILAHKFIDDFELENLGWKKE